MKLTKNDKICCDFIIRYGNDYETHRGFYDTYDNVIKEYNSIKLNANITWKQILWEPLVKCDVQIIVKEDSVKVMEILGAQFIIPATN